MLYVTFWCYPRMGSMVGGGCAGRILTNQYGFSSYNIFDDKARKQGNGKERKLLR